MSVIINSIKKSLSAIVKNKKIFLLIVTLETVFLLLITMVGAFYMSKILQSTSNILQYTDTLNIDPQTTGVNILQRQSPLGNDPLLISRNYHDIKKNSLILLSYIFIIFVLFNGLAWYFSSNLIDKKKISMKIILRYLMQFFVLSVILYGFLLLLGFNALKIFFSEFLLTQPITFAPLLILSIAAVYFIYTAISLLNKVGLRSKIIFKIGIKNFTSLTLSYLIILSLYVLASLLILYSIEKNLILLSIGLILLLLIIAWSKIFLTAIVSKLSLNQKI